MAMTTDFSPTRVPDEQLASEVRLAEVGLTVHDAARSAAFYREVLGLAVHHDEDVVRLTSDAAHAPSGSDVLVLTEDADARQPGRRAGMYHVALLYPTRTALANVLQRISLAGVPIQGASDHGTHEAIYLPDPDGIGLELAADRPRERWRPYDMDGKGPRPLDLEDLLRAADEGPGTNPPIPGIGVGHLHLHVNDLAAAETFWVDVVGFDKMFGMDTACFVAAGGYHHHLGFNIWRGEGIPSADPEAIGMRYWTIEVPGQAELSALRERLTAAAVDITALPGGGIEFTDPAGMRAQVRTRD